MRFVFDKGRDAVRYKIADSVDRISRQVTSRSPPPAAKEEERYDMVKYVALDVETANADCGRRLVQEAGELRTLRV